MTRLIAIRHGRTDWNDAKKLQGRTDIPLNAAGIADVRSWSLPKPLGTPDLWISSPLSRAMQTAEILAPEGTNIETDARLREMSFGDWEGRTLADLRAVLGPAMLENEARGLDFRPQGGESPRDVVARLRPFLEDLGARLDGSRHHALQNGQFVICVCHKAVIRAMMALATGWDMTDKAPLKLRSGRFIQFDLSKEGAMSNMQAHWMDGMGP